MIKIVPKTLHRVDDGLKHPIKYFCLRYLLVKIYPIIFPIPIF